MRGEVQCLLACAMLVLAQPAPAQPGPQPPATDALAARLVIDGVDAGGAAVVRVRGECLAISALHVMEPQGEAPASAADLRFADGRHARVVVRRRLPGIDAVLLTFQDVHNDFCGDELSLIGLDAALRYNAGSVDLARDRGQREAIAVRIDGVYDSNEVALLAEAPRLEAGISGSPVLIGGRFIGIIRTAASDRRHGVATRIDAIAAAAQDIISLPRSESGQGRAPPDKADRFPELLGDRTLEALVVVIPAVARPSIAAAAVAGKRALDRAKEAVAATKTVENTLLKQKKEYRFTEGQAIVPGRFYRFTVGDTTKKFVQYLAQIDRYYDGDGKVSTGVSGYGSSVDFDGDTLLSSFDGKFLKGDYQSGCYTVLAQSEADRPGLASQYSSPAAAPPDASAFQDYSDYSVVQKRPKFGTFYNRIYEVASQVCGGAIDEGRFSGRADSFGPDGLVFRFFGTFARFPDDADLEPLGGKAAAPPANSIGVFGALTNHDSGTGGAGFVYVGATGDRGWEGYVAVYDARKAQDVLVAVERYSGGRLMETLPLRP